MTDEVLQLDIQGAPTLEAKIANLVDGDIAQKILDEGAAILFDSIRRRFLQGVDSQGDPWPALTDQTQRRHDQKGGGGILYDTGTLFHSIQLYAPDAETRAIGTDVPYARFHQFGTAHLPKRQFLGVSTQDARSVQDLLVQRIADAWKA